MSSFNAWKYYLVFAMILLLSSGFILSHLYHQHFIRSFAYFSIIRNWSNPIQFEKELAEKRFPDALIIGVKKGGTGALLEFLGMHPDVVAPMSEVHFFNKFHHLGINFYLSKFPAVKPGKILLEKTPAYFHDKKAAKLIMETLGPTIKLIVVFRNPVDRMISDFTHDKIGGILVRSFHDLAFTNCTSLEVDPSFDPLVRSKYINHINRFIKAGFTLENFIFVDGDLLSKNPATELARVEQFLGIRSMFSESMFYYDDAKGFPCVNLHNPFSDGTIKEGGLGSKNHPRRCLDKTKGRSEAFKPRLTQQQRESFVRYFAPWNRQFFKLLGHTIPSWQCAAPNRC